MAGTPALAVAVLMAVVEAVGTSWTEVLTHLVMTDGWYTDSLGLSQLHY